MITYIKKKKKTLQFTWNYYYANSDLGSYRDGKITVMVYTVPSSEQKNYKIVYIVYPVLHKNLYREEKRSVKS